MKDEGMKCMNSYQRRLSLAILVLLSLIGVIAFYGSSRDLMSMLAGTTLPYTRSSFNSNSSTPVTPESTSITGSFANCNSQILSTITPNLIISEKFIRGTVTLSCRELHYQTPNFNNFKEVTENKERKDVNLRIIIGVLSSAGSPQKRSWIRQTWSQNQIDVYFLVAGPWEDIEEEFSSHLDMIWIQHDEIYNGEESVLTLKTYGFFSIFHQLQSHEILTFDFLFKTDDDSYVNIPELYLEVEAKKDKRLNYLGTCRETLAKVHRETEGYKWSIRNETYPEPFFPRYCQGGGYLVSDHFINCSVSQGHISNIRFMPFEDVAVGMLAERCGVDPIRTKKVQQHRYKSIEARVRDREKVDGVEDLVLPAACMTNKIVQHRISSRDDMMDHHRTVLDPKYCNVTMSKRKKIIQQKKEKGVKWFGRI